MTTENWQGINIKGGKPDIHDNVFVFPPGEPTERNTPQTFNVPYPRNGYFTGRDELLQTLHKALQTEGAAALSQAKAIYGLGGVGKTQTAVEYAYRYQNAYEWVFWVKADTDLNLATDFGKIAVAVGLSPSTPKTLDETVREVKRWLETTNGWLLIFDNADTPSLLKPYRPNNPNGRILITSRAQGFAELGIAQPLEVREMSPEDALWFLFKRVDRSIPTSSLAARANHPEYTAASELAAELAYLPLALEQAGAYISQKQVQFGDYLTSYRTRRLHLLERQRPQAGDYPLTVATTWDLNFHEVEQIQPAATDLLQFSAFLAPDDIPYELLMQGADQLGELLSTALSGVRDDLLVLSELLEPLTRYSLIRIEPEAYCYSIHRMVQEVLRDHMDTLTRQQWVERSVESLNVAFPAPEFENWLRCDRLLTHVQSVFQQLEQYPCDSFAAGRLLSNTARYLKEQGHYSEAEPLYRRSLAILEQQLGEDHSDVAASLNNLAGFYRTQGCYQEAEPLLKRSLAIAEHQLGEDHPYVATSLNNLAELYRLQGRYLEAEPFHLRSLAIREQQLGKDHPDVANSLNNLALLYYSQGRYLEAEPFHLRSLAIREQQLGKDHPDVANSLNNLANLYHSQERYSEAESLFVRSLAIFEQQLSSDHPDVATSLNNLAELYQVQGHYSKAEPLFLRSLAIFEQLLGSDHPNVATSLNNLAGLYYLQERYGEAEKLFAEALDISERRLGVGHLDTISVRANLIRVLRRER